MKQWIAVCADAKKGDVQVGEDGAQVTRNERQQKKGHCLEARLSCIDKSRHVRHQEDDPNQTVLGPLGTLLAEEGQNSPS